MNIFIVHAHAEPKSFNGALFQTAQETLRAAGHAVTISDLYAMKFDPVSDRRNFTTVKNADFFKQQIEEMHVTEVGGFAPDVEAEIRKMEERQMALKAWAARLRTVGNEQPIEVGEY